MSKTSKLQTSVPAWASFFTPAEYGQFSYMLELELAKRGLERESEDSGLVRPKGGDPTDRWGLLNLAQICRDKPAGEWSSLIAAFFEDIIRVEMSASQILETLRSFDKVRAQLKLRLQPEDYLQHPHVGSLVLERIASGIVGLLVCDLGQVNVSIPSDLPERWGVSREELFALAKQNVRAEGKLMQLEGLPMNGAEIDFFSGHSNYGATHVLWFEEYCERATGYGALLTVPNRHMVFCHMIRDQRVFEAVELLKMVTEQAYEDGPGSISQEIYWWRPGRLELLQTMRLGGRLVVMPEEEFERLVIESIMKGN